jgi:hypothetical protein
LASSAHACRATPEKQLRTKISEPTAANPFRLIGSSGKACDVALVPFTGGPLAKSLEAYTKRELTETALVMVAAGGEVTKTALFLCYAQRRAGIGRTWATVKQISRFHIIVVVVENVKSFGTEFETNALGDG